MIVTPLLLLFPSNGNNCNKLTVLNIVKKNEYERRAFLSSSILITSSFPTSLVGAITSSEAERSYDTYASSYDQLDGGDMASRLGIQMARCKLIGEAKGKVLEIGCGTGLNLPFYKFASSLSANDGVTSLTLLDISDQMMNEAQAKVEALNIPSFVPVEFMKGDATTDLTQAYGTEGEFDTIIDTFSLCVMGNEGAKRCLNQMKSVLKPMEKGGKMYLIENTRSSNTFIGGYQDLTADAAAKLGGKGCVFNQDVTSFIKSTEGLQIVKEEPFAAGVFCSYTCQRSK
jgi:ubiquinone/menaquinone biosynthesis C-methylase UbiE